MQNELFQHQNAISKGVHDQKFKEVQAYMVQMHQCNSFQILPTLESLLPAATATAQITAATTAVTPVQRTFGCTVKQSLFSRVRGRSIQKEKIANICCNLWLAISTNQSQGNTRNRIFTQHFRSLIWTAVHRILTLLYVIYKFINVANYC